MTNRRPYSCLLALALVATVAAIVPAMPASAVNAAHPQIVSATPGSGTPQVQDGQVNAIVQVGNTIVAGGLFTQVREPGGPILNRRNLFAFDATTGAISSTFVPDPDGEVLTLATDGTSVFVGGSFGVVNGITAKRLAKLNLANGQAVAGFSVNINSGAAVYDMAVANGRLYLGGAFSMINGAPRERIAALDASTGALDPNLNVVVAGKHNGGTLRVHKLDVTPDGTKLIAIGNFLTVNGLNRRQIFMLNLASVPVTVANWQTSRFEVQCNARFDTYMRDVDFSPDGSYFVIGTTGAFVGGVNAGVLCDTITRWETGATGSGLQPSWADYSGGDTTFSVASTGAAVYVGGHQRWWNNPFRGDNVGPGAVSRPGIAALDPVNGLPFSWNPVRDPRGLGVFALIATSEGLWLGSDTCDIAGLQRCRIAFMPLAGGTPVPPDVQFGLPNDLFTLPATPSQFMTRRSFTGSTFGSVSNLNTPGTDWSLARGSFVTNGRLYSAWSNGQFLVRTFDGTTVGPPVSIPLNGLTSSNFPISNTTGMFFTNGRIYYTVTNDARLFYRYFTPESGVIGAVTFVASGAGDGLNWGAVRGMTMAQGRIYFARTNLNLYRMDFVNGLPVPGTEALISGPSTGDGRIWNVRDLFIAGTSVDTFPPTAPGKPAGASTVVGSIDLTWTAADDSTSDTLTYRVFRDAETSPITTFTSAASGSISYTDADLAPGGTHTYFVTATDAANNVSTSPTSDPIVVLAPDTTAPTAPGTPTGSALGSRRIELTWDASTDDRSTTVTYHVFRDAESEPVGEVASASTTTVGFIDTGLEPGSTHTYVVTATDEADNTSTSGASAPITTVATIFADSFASGGLANWTTSTRLTIDGSTGGEDPPSVRAQVTAQTAWAAKDLSTSYSSICMSVAVNVASTGGTALDLLRLRTAGNGDLAKVVLSSSGILQFRSDVSGIVRGSGATLPSGWHTVEVCGTVGTAGTWDLYLDSAKVLDAWTADTGTLGVGRVQIGNNTSKTFTANFDDVVVDQEPG